MNVVAMLSVAALTAGASAQVVIAPSASLAPVPGFAGDGLNGSIYNNVNAGAIAEWDAIIASTVPAATFVSSLVDYPNGGPDNVNNGQTWDDLLGVDAASLTESGVVGSQLYRFTGFIAIEAAGVLTFAIGSDDGAVLRIGGQDIIAVPGDRGFAFSFGDAEFDAAGLYAIEIILYANGAGQTGIELYSSIAGGTDSGAPASGLSVIPTRVLYTVPAPASAIALALAGLTAARRRR